MKAKIFCAVPNLVAQDGDLSLKAKGLYLLIQSCMEDPIFFYNHFRPALEGKCNDRDDVFDEAWEELRKAGYLKQHRVSHGGRGYHYEYTLLAAADDSNALLETGNGVGRSIPAVQPIRRTKTDAVNPAPVKCGECRFRICNNKCDLDEQPRWDFDDDDFCSQGKREIPSKQLITRARTE